MPSSVGPSIDPDHRWQTAGISSSEAEARQRQNLASLDRKITYCVNRPVERLQWQWVEGWTTGEVLDRMRAAGIAEARIQRDFYGR